MRKFVESNRLLLFVYGCLLLCLASFFVMREHRLPHLLENKLPFLFIIRFGVFWFVSLMIAVVLYLVYLSYQYLLLKEADRMRARWVGKLTFWLGVAVGAGLTLLTFLFRRFPEYFYL